MASRWARPAAVLNSYSLLTGLCQRAVNAGCMFAAFITLPYHCHESGTCSSKGKHFKHNVVVTRVSMTKCKILKEVAEEVIGFHSRRQFNCSCDFQITRAVAKSQWFWIERYLLLSINLSRYPKGRSVLHLLVSHTRKIQFVFLARTLFRRSALRLWQPKAAKSQYYKSSLQINVIV